MAVPPIQFLVFTIEEKPLFVKQITLAPGYGNSSESRGFLHDFFLEGNTRARKGGEALKQFVCNTKIISGENALDAMKELAAKKVMVITDPFFKENGMAAAIGARAGGEIRYFDKVTPDPSVQLAAEGTAALKAFGPDLIIALGGGSAMDCAKAMVYFSGTDARFVAIPTTSGSGSEVTDFAILTHNGVKHPVVDPKMRPDMAILDPSLLEKLPKGLIADTGFDVICHALEAYVATGANAVTDALAKDAFCTAFALLPASFGQDRPG